MDVSGVISELVGGAIGGAAVATGLSRWFGELWLGRILAKDRSKYDKELEQLKAAYSQNLESCKDALERSKNLLQAQIDRSVFVTRAHFETEFEAYKKIFEDLAEVRLLMSIMHPMLRVGRENETRDERFEELIANATKLSDAHNKAIRTVENLAPFFPYKIFAKLNKCLQLVRLEMIHVQTGGPHTFYNDWNRVGEERTQQFLVSYGELSDAVRQRIATLAVLPNSG